MNWDSVCNAGSPLSKEREMEAIEEFKAGKEPERSKALLDLTLGFAKFIRFFLASKKYKVLESHKDDLMSEAYIGFIRSIEKYDAAFSTSLSTYAAFWIKTFSSRYLLGTRKFFRIPPKKRHALMKEIRENPAATSDKVIRNLMEKHNMDPWEALLTYQWFVPENVSICDVECDRDRDVAIHEHMAELPENINTIFDAEKAVGILSEKEAEVIRRRFWNDDTLEEIGQDFGLSRERIRQIEALAIEKMRRYASKV